MFLVWKRNDCAIELFLALYLFSIYFEYMYISVSWICTYTLENMSVYVVLIVFGIDNDHVILFISHTNFNKAYWFYLQALPVKVDLLFRLRFTTVSRLGLRIYIYVWIYVFLIDNLVVYPFGSLFLERKWHSHDSLTFNLF